MPGNKAGDRSRNLFELENPSEIPNAADSNWPLLAYNQWVGNTQHVGEPLGFSTKGYSIQQLDYVGGLDSESLKVPVNQNYSQWTSRLELCSNPSRNQQENPNGFIFSAHSFEGMPNGTMFSGETACYDPHILMFKGLSLLKSHQENASGDSPTLTTNSERSEITEASTDFNFPGGSQQFERGLQQKQNQLPYPMQQSGYNDMQLLQQRMMFKQLEELRRQQQLQQLSDARQQSSSNQFPAFVKQGTRGHFPSLINGNSVTDASQMLMNWVQRGVPPVAQCASNRAMFTHEHGNDLQSTGLVPQQLDVSLYGTPISSGRGTTDQYSQNQLTYHDSANMLAGPAGMAQKPIMQSSTFGNHIVGGHSSVDQVGMPFEASILKQGFHGKNMSGHVPYQGLDGVVTSGNTQLEDTLQISLEEQLHGREDGASWPQQKEQDGPVEDLVPLDPIEEKILYNMDDSVWNASLGRNPGVGSFQSSMENLDYSNAFPSVQSGSWSALMQSAVAEAANSDTGIQEEWSGLTFQNADLSTDNQPSVVGNSQKLQPGHAENTLQSSSLGSGNFSTFNNPSLSSSFPGFQEPGVQLPLHQREVSLSQNSHESIQKTPMDTVGWLGGNIQQQKLLGVRSQSVELPEHMGNAWLVQSNEHSESGAHQQRSTSYNDIAQPQIKPQGDINEATYGKSDFLWKPVGELDYKKQGGPSKSNAENESIRKGRTQLSNGFVAVQNPFEGASEMSSRQLHQRDNSFDSRLSGRAQRRSDLFNFIGGVSGNSLNLVKGHLSNLQGGSKGSENQPSTGSLDAFSALHNSVSSDFPNANAQPSENVLEFRHKADQMKENSSLLNYSTAGSSVSKISGTEHQSASAAQEHNQLPSSQGFSLRLAPPSQQFYSSNSALLPPGLLQSAEDLNSRLGNSEPGEKSQTSLPSPSVQNSPSSHESTQTAQWDDKMNAFRQAGIASSLLMQGNSVTAFTSSPRYAGNQSQMQPLPSPSFVSFPSATGRYPLSNISPQQIPAEVRTQQYPVLETFPVSQPPVMSGIAQWGGLPVRQPDGWPNLSNQQHLSAMDIHKLPSMTSLNSTETHSLPQQGLNDLNFRKSGHGSLELGMYSTNSLGLGHKEEAERFQKSFSTDMDDAQQTVGITRNISGAFASSSMLGQQQQQQIGGMHLGEENTTTTSERNYEFAGHSFKQSHVFQNKPELYKVQAMKNVETDPRKVQQVKSLLQQNSVYEEKTPGACGSENTSQLNSLRAGNSKMVSFMAGAREATIKALSEPLQGISSEPVIADQIESRGQSKMDYGRVNRAENPQLNQMGVASWMKHLAALRNSQMPPTDNSDLSKTSGGQFPLGKPSPNLHATPDGVSSANAFQSSRVWQSTASNLVENERMSPHVFPSDATGQSFAAPRQKKRKFAIAEPQPWHKEVMQYAGSVQNIRISEEAWAQATNRLIEKVEDENEVVEDGQLVHGSKRRLLVSTQLMQQLLRPAPSSIPLRASCQFDSVTYFVARLSLGDACSLTNRISNESSVPANGSNPITENVRARESTDDKHIAKVVGEFSKRARKMEDYFLRFEKAASLVDLRVECQDLERFSVINRFAKFHIRHTDASGTSSSSGIAAAAPRAFLQRYVTVLPMPKNLPEEVQCHPL